MLRGRPVFALMAFVFLHTPGAAAAPGAVAHPVAAGIPTGDTLELRYAGRSIPGPQAPDLYELPRGMGTSLAEVFPPQVEAWKLEVRTASGSLAFERDELAELLSSIFLLKTSAGWDLYSERGAIAARGVTALTLYGDPCPEKSLEAWISWEGVPALKAEITRFAEKAGVTVKLVDVPSIKGKLATVMRGGGRAPDLALIQSDYLPDFLDIDALQSLDSLVLPATDSKGREAFTLSGRRWAAPFYCDAQLVFYNPALVSGPVHDDWTLADFERLARGSKAKVKAAWNAYSAYWLVPFLAGFGKDPLVSPDGGIRVSDEACERALSFLVGLRDRGILEPLERDAMTAFFASGKAAFILSASYDIPEFTRLGIPFAVAPYPLVAPGGRRVAGLVDYKGFAVPRTARSPVLARRLIQHLSGPGVEARFCSALGKLPAPDGARELALRKNPWAAQMRVAFASGIAVPPAPAYARWKNVMWKLLRLLFSGEMGAKEVLATCDDMVSRKVD